MATRDNTELTDAFDEFYREFYRNEIGALAQNYPEDQKSLLINWEDLYRYDPDLADDYRNKPEQIQDYAEEALRLYDLPVDVKLGQAHVRVKSLPDSVPIGDLRHEHHGRLIAVQGVVREMTQVSPKVTTAAFECQRCGTLTRIPQVSGDFQDPHECQGCERNGPFRLNMDQSEFIDSQKLRIQELPGNYDQSDTPPRIDVAIEDDITGQVGIGDRVTITGVLKLEQQGTDRSPSSLFDTRLEGIAIEDTVDTYPEVEISEGDQKELVEFSNDDPFEKFVESLAPSVEGHEQLKEAIVLQLFGGVRKDFPDGASSRGNIHTLIVSDPGQGISRLVGRSSRFAPRAVSISGTDTTRASLTAPATASSDAPGDDPWEIKAGATVMADQGVLYMDNLEGLDQGALSDLGSVLEEQKVNASKASQQKSFPARTSVLAAGKPKYGQFEEFEPLGEQLDFLGNLLSSVDLVFVTQDDGSDDEETAEHILDLSQAAQRQNNPSSEATDNGEVSADIEDYEPPIDAYRARQYIAYARTNCYPMITDKAKQSLQEFYSSIHSQTANERGVVPVSGRDLEAMIRLAEASARTRLADTIMDEDIERVKEIVRSSHRELGTLGDEEGRFEDVVSEGDSVEGQHNPTEIVWSAIDKLESEYDEGAPIDAIIDHAEDSGISSSKAEEEIEQLKTGGHAYEPRTDHLRTTGPLF